MIIFLYGEDDFRSQEKLKQIKARFQDKDPQGLNLSIWEGELDFQSLQETIRQLPFLGKTRLVIVKDVWENQKIVLKKINTFLKEQEISSSTIIVFWQGDVPDRRSSLFKTLINKARCEIFKPLLGYQLEQWVRQKIEKEKAKIENPALRELCLRVGSDLKQMHNEISKLLAYCDQESITESAVRELVRAPWEADIFKLVDALSQKDQENALKFIQDQLALGASELYLLAMLTFAFRNLLLVKDLTERGETERRIVQETKLHPFVVRKTLGCVDKFSFSVLKKIYNKLLDLDFKIKTGRIKADFGLSMLVFGAAS